MEPLERRQLLASITGSVFLDTDRDGRWDSGESGVGSRTIYLDADNDSRLDANERTTATDSTGRYTFTNLPAGTYKIRQVLPAGYIQTFPSKNYGRNATLTATGSASGLDFGTDTTTPPASGATIRGFVFEDADRDGVRDAGEAGVASRVIYLDPNNNSKLDPGEITTTTDAAGDYVFANLPAGTYKIRQVLPADYIQTIPSKNYGRNATLSGTQTASGLSFGTVRITPVSTLTDKIDHAFDYAKTSLTQTMNDINHDANTFVERTRAEGNWLTKTASSWTAGFLGGSMWQVYDASGETAWRENATKWTTSLAGRTNETGDLAFKFMTTYLPLYEFSGSATHRNVLLAAAASKNAQWNQTVGAFETKWFKTRSGDPSANFAVLMDMTTDMELLIWAGRETGNQQYIDRAIAHTRKVIAEQIRADGSISQFAMYDRATGEFVMQETYQGYNNDGVWSRGQAWAVLSLSMMARETGLAEFADAAKKVSEYFITHLPGDSVPYWDFTHPDIPNTYRDSSAAAVAASGLLDLSNTLTDPALKTRYREAAEKIIESLLSPAYFNEGTTQRGLLAHGAGNVPNDPWARDTSLIYGDYYLLKAMNQWRAIQA